PRSAAGVEKLRARPEMLGNEIIQITPNGQPSINARDERIGAPAFLLAASPIGVPALGILQRLFGLENRRKGRRKKEALRLTDRRPVKLQQPQGASSRFAPGHLGAAVRARGKRDGHFLDGKAVAVQDEEALEKE